MDTGEYAAAARAVTSAAVTVTDTVRETHRAIAGRFLRLLPPPVRVVQETGTDLIYLAVRSGIGAVGAVTAFALDTVPATRGARPFTATPGGRRLAGMVDGAFGSHLDAQRHPGLAGAMSVRVDGAPITLDGDTLAAHHPTATGAIVVLLHGLIETEEWWNGPGGDGGDFGTRLTADLGVTCVRVRYNSGQPIARSGAELDAVLDALVAAWPVPVTSIALVGHSMGGLVARHALAAATEHGHSWPVRVRHLVCLGTPHTGSPLERGAAGLARLLSRFAETAALAELIDTRSAGIKDLASGFAGADDTAVPIVDLETDRTPVSLHRGNVAATLSRDPRNLLGRVAGDLLVQPGSALPRTPDATSVAIGGIGHFALLRHDLVYDVVRDWLADTAAVSPADQPVPP